MLRIVSIVLYMAVGLISIVMAGKTLFAKQFLPFHASAAGKNWHDLDNGLKILILFLLRLVGMGFLTMGLLLLVCPVINYFMPNPFYDYFVPAVALVFCVGLLVNSYGLHKRTGADTPWKGSLFAVAALCTGIICCFVG